MERSPAAADIVALGLLAAGTLAAFVALAPSSTAPRLPPPNAGRGVTAAPQRRPPRPPRVVREPSTASQPRVSQAPVVSESVETGGSSSQPLVALVGEDLEELTFDGRGLTRGHGVYMDGWSYRHGGRYYRRGRFPRVYRSVPSQPVWMAPMAMSYAGEGSPGAVVCDLFPLACGQSAPRGARFTGRVARVPAAVEQHGSRWDLSNETLVASVDPSVWCRVLLSRPGEIPSTTERLGWSIDVPEPAPCAVSETAPSWAGVTGAALSITWNGRGWTQRAVVSLDDDAGSPEVEVVRDTVGSDGATVHTERRWSFDEGLSAERVDARASDPAPGQAPRAEAGRS